MNIDIEIATLLGWTVLPAEEGNAVRYGKNPAGRTERIPSYSSDIGAAWQLVSRLRGRFAVRDYGDGWACEITPALRPDVVRTTADSAAMAIALMAMERL